ncbi:hypothetical protein GobsT_70310 [Gemmata obscuriglobus]|uniref:Uncharacterized protein n=1 Tax=Gemmata obscuriglobus TaxID=114 RepID=A0A2Z3H747_9BACT|nr:hypothetical protein [Gemmata obscuriglobus]AWM41853.1 hypothetical protein C1280_35920 [Gemmata obscuriglobus]QEG32179.1 hypothetical protein GobsT_70310 [Gemmata obscuriglobus]VTS11532.1 unnamed protein product [Gemmata obscuriglobus UQM 2246]
MRRHPDRRRRHGSGESSRGAAADPDAVTPQEAENPLFKELELKPTALQPFYVDPGAEFSDEIVRRRNEKFATETAH